METILIYEFSAINTYKYTCTISLFNIIIFLYFTSKNYHYILLKLSSFNRRSSLTFLLMEKQQTSIKFLGDFGKLDCHIVSSKNAISTECHVDPIWYLSELRSRITHLCGCKIYHHRLKLWCVACTAPNHYPNQCGLIVILALCKKGSGIESKYKYILSINSVASDEVTQPSSVETIHWKVFLIVLLK